MKIFGIDVNVSNLFDTQEHIYSAFWAIETWVLVHGWIPRNLFVFLFNRPYWVWVVVAIFYAWETFEAIVYGTLKIYANAYPNRLPPIFVKFFGEQTSDAQLGDPAQGFIATVSGWWDCHKVMDSKFIRNNGLWAKRTRYQKLSRLIHLAVLALPSILGPLYIIPNPELPHPASLYEWFSFPLNYFPFGFYAYAFITTLILYYMRHIDLSIFGPKGYAGDVYEVYDYHLMYWYGSVFATQFFFYSTYFTLWIFYICYAIYVWALPRSSLDKTRWYTEPCCKKWDLDYSVDIL